MVYHEDEDRYSMAGEMAFVRHEYWVNKVYKPSNLLKSAFSALSYKRSISSQKL